MFTLRFLTAMVDGRRRSRRVNRAFPTSSVEGLETRQLLSVGGLPAAHTDRLPVRPMATQLIVGLERRIQSGPIADREAGQIGQALFITEVSRLLAEFDQEVDRRLLPAHPSVAARLKGRVDQIRTALAAQAHQDDENNLALHIHVYLTIRINGRPVTIPANIGITAMGAGPVHTHDASGKIHVESEVIRTFRLADFFAAWGRTFNHRDILGHRTDATHQITMTVNGRRSLEFENLILRDGDRIVIRFGPKGQPLG
jgi:hypothetical protein